MRAKSARKPKRANGPRTRVALMAEYPVFTEALGVVVSLEADLEYVGSATTIEDAVVLVTELSPDVAVVDLGLPGPTGPSDNGGEATKRIKDARPETRILVLAADMDIDTMANVASDGACGFLSKTSGLDEICHAIRTAKDGGMFVERELLPDVLQRLRTPARRQIGGGSARAQITTREQDVLTLLGEGLDVAVIAKRLGISQNTCRGHVKNLLVKLGSHSQLEAVVEAVHQGLLPHLSR
jgi:DNA-binding NarL/FixJ family response regulator